MNEYALWVEWRTESCLCLHVWFSLYSNEFPQVPGVIKYQKHLDPNGLTLSQPTEMPKPCHVFLQFDCTSQISWHYNYKHMETILWFDSFDSKVPVTCQKQISCLTCCLPPPQLETRRASRTWTWMLCASVSSVSSSGTTAEKTISAQWCPTPSMTRVRHHQTHSMDSHWTPSIRNNPFLDFLSMFVVVVYRGHNHFAAEDHLFEPEQRLLSWQDGDLHAVWQSAERWV